MSDLLRQLAIVASALASRQVERKPHVQSILGSWPEEFRCKECLGAWNDPERPAHAELCIVGIAEALIAAARWGRSEQGTVNSEQSRAVLPCEAEVAMMLASRKVAGRKAGPSAMPQDDKNQGQFAEPWRIATGDETDPCRRYAGSLMNADDEVIASPRTMQVDYREAEKMLGRIRDCVNFFAGVPSLEIIGTAELTNEQIAAVGGVGAAQGLAVTA